MKVRFNTYDIVCGVTELQKLIGLRVNQVYDIDNKTYLIKFQHTSEKCILLLESGIRFHTTAFEWPKNVSPSGFSMKLRKHLKNKRLESFQQIGVDRIVSLKFGTGEASYYVILELYDRGNIILTDHELTILNILRPHTEGEEIRFAVREKYPINRAKVSVGVLSEDKIRDILESATPGDNLRKIFIPILDCGPSVVEHVLLRYELADCVIGGKEIDCGKVEKQQSKKAQKQKKKENMNIRDFDFEKDFERLKSALKEVDEMMHKAREFPSKGFAIQKKELKPSEYGGSEEYFFHNIEYHPFLFLQYTNQPYKEFDTFMAAVDEFYSTLEGQKIDLKALQQEREALKKLSNVKKDHAKRLEELNKTQEEDKQKAELITRNQTLVDNAILAIRSALANQMSWPDINELVKAAQANNDPVAHIVKQLKLETNHIVLYLQDPYTNDEGSDNEDRLPPATVDVDLALSAFANARKYYDQKRNAAKKEQRTIDASEKALKSAEKKTQLALKDVRTISTISKVRKVYWFEKFYWFISSENYLVIGGRDSQQNELIVKRYMRSTDIYVHAEIQGASSIIIRNPTGGEVPPKTLVEAGTMAISYSVAWDAKVITNAYWVRSEQVSKTAPTGEYLGTGSFMIRGKKNFLPPCHFIMGLGLLFKLEDSSIERHKGERRMKVLDEQSFNPITQLHIENEKLEDVAEEEEIEEERNKESASETELEDDKIGTKDEIPTLKFPDTLIKIEHDTGNVTIQGGIQNNKEGEFENLKNDRKSSQTEFLVADEETDSVEQSYILSALPIRKKNKVINSKKKKKEKHEIEIKHKEMELKKVDKNGSQVKRGQRGKLKKMKIKYRDQDEEERQLRMQILKSAGTEKPKDEESKNECSDKIEYQKQSKTLEQHQQEIDETDDIPVSVDTDMLDSLTGCPIDEDELLFAIPVVAPYQTLQNYKYKIKLTPGTSKRGKAAKTALLMFTKDKSCTNREKDLLKGIKEESLARNIPGKVKISAPQLQKFKAK